MTPFDAVTRHAVYVERLKAQAVRKVLDLLAPLGRDVFTTVAASDLESLTRRELQALLAELNRQIKSGYAPIIADIDQTLRDFGAYEGGWQGGMLQRTGLISNTLGVASDADIWAAVNANPFDGKFLRQWLAGLPAGTARRIREAVTQGYADGVGALEVARDIRGTRSRNGLWSMSSRGAEAMVRTAFNHTATVARSETYKKNPTIKYEQWTSVLDHRTTPVCFPAETEVVPAGDLRSAFKREYRGEMLTIATANGNKLRCTPNHPILTPSGWLAAAELKEGDQIVKVDVGDVSGVTSADNVSVETGIGAIYDAFSHPAVSTVKVESSSPAQFHGDGMAGNYKVNIASADVELRHWIKSIGDKSVKECLLHGSHLFGAMPSSAHLLDHLVGRLPSVKAAQITPSAVKDAVEPRLAPSATELPQDFCGAGSVIEQPDSLSSVSNALDTLEPLRGLFADADLSEVVGDSCGCGFVEPADTGEAFPFPVSLDNVVSIGRKLVSCHVYNLHTHLGYYIAGGVIVKNCQSRDGNFYPVGEGPRPPAHIACRSTMVPVTSRNRARLESRMTYNEWLTGQKASVQDDILGKAKGQLFRKGDLTVDKFVNRAGQEYTLDQLKEKDAEAWAEAFGNDTVGEAVQEVRK